MRTRLYGELAAGMYLPREDPRPSLVVLDDVSPSWLATAADLIDELAILDATARAAIAERSRAGVPLVVDYLRFHHEELGLPVEVDQLVLCGLGVRTTTLVLDYTFILGDTRVSDELLVVCFDAARRLVAITHES